MSAESTRRVRPATGGRDAARNDFLDSCDSADSRDAEDSLHSRADERHQRIGYLLDRARDGDRTALDELITDLTPLLWNIARAQGLAREAAEDVVQTTWLILLRGLAGIRSPVALVGWLTTVTRREAWRARAAEVAWLPVDDARVAARADPDPAPDDVAANEDRRRILWAAVRRLSPRCQQLLRVVAFAPRPSYAELAQAMGMPHGSIGPSRGRCLAKLRGELAVDRRWSGL